MVDDDPAILDMFKDIFARNQKVELRTCSTGYDAGMLTEAFRPSLIILDFMLPDINGDLVCRRLREREDFADTKVLFVSGVISEAELAKLKDAGSNGFLRKPFDVSELMSRVNALLEI